MDVGKVGILHTPHGPESHWVSGLLLLLYNCGRQLKSGGGETNNGVAFGEGESVVLLPLF